MASARVYLDHNATAPLAAAAREAVCRALEVTGNPSSVHAEGRAAHAVIEQAREQVAALAGVAARRVIFTSGATEAANLALTAEISSPAGPRRDALVICGGEHPCVREGHRFLADAVHHVALNADGVVDLGALDKVLAGLAPGRALVALQAANNETGVIQPVREAADMVHAYGGLLLCDAVQAIHRMECTAASTGVDMLIVSAHKLGGPKGAGALLLANPSIEITSPLLRGGGQERGARAGTENVPAIAGFGAASAHAAAIRETEMPRLQKLRDAFEAGLRSTFPDAIIFGENAERLANTSAFAIPGFTAETMVMALDLEGIAVSSGSACSSGKVKPSLVLENMGVEPDLARCALRISEGEGNSEADIEKALAALASVVQRISARRMKPAA